MSYRRGFTSGSTSGVIFALSMILFFAAMYFMLGGCTGGWINTTQIKEAERICSTHNGVHRIGSDRTVSEGRFVFTCNDSDYEYTGPYIKAE